MRRGETTDDREQCQGGDRIPSTQALTVYYDGACPLCQREINMYRSAMGAQCVTWVDVSASLDEHVARDLTRDDALSRFHVRDGHGQLKSGAAAFAELWMVLPSFYWLGRLVSLPGIKSLADRTYSAFLQVRPLIKKFF